MSHKPCGFASFRRCQLAGGEVWAGLWDCVWWVYGGCIVGVGVWGMGVDMELGVQVMIGV